MKYLILAIVSLVLVGGCRRHREFHLYHHMDTCECKCDCKDCSCKHTHDKHDH